jgi:hypothetical protein
MCFARGSRLFPPVRCWEELPIFYISAWGWMSAAVDSTTAGSTSSFPCFFVLPISCASWLHPLFSNSQLT